MQKSANERKRVQKSAQGLNLADLALSLDPVDEIEGVLPITCMNIKTKGLKNGQLATD
jgi:hypothetical protein